MPLTRGTIVGYDAARMSFKFTMMNEHQIVNCEISGVALDELDGTRWTSGKLADRNAQFSEHRDKIEELASRQFDARPDERTKPVRVFWKHVPK